jgi:short-subunit dehydrogenase
VWGNFAELGLEEQTKMLNLNINTVIELTYFLLPACASKSKLLY